MSWNKYDTKTNPKWTWFEAIMPQPNSQQIGKMVDACVADLGASREAAEAAVVDCLHKGKNFVNHYYEVQARYSPSGEGKISVAHLSIKNRKRSVIRDWRDLQQIKNDLVGPEFEGVEIFPKESQLVDTANQYHLWVICDPDFSFPFGWHQGRRVTNSEDGGNKQRFNPSFEKGVLCEK